MTSLPQAALKSLPGVLFLMLVCSGFLAFLALPGVGTMLGSSVCEAGETMVSVETPYSRPGESGVAIDYYCEDASGARRDVGVLDLILAALKYYVAFWLLVAWPLLTWRRYRSGVSEERMRREGLPATARITSYQTTGWRVNEAPMVKLQMEITPQGRPPFTKKVFKRVHEMEVPSFQPGRTFNALVDPQRPDNVLILWDEAAPPAVSVNARTVTMDELPPQFAEMVQNLVGSAGGEAASRARGLGESADELDALRALRTMRDEGLIDEAEYEAKKAEIMGRL